MAKHIKKSVVPIYMIGVTWLVYSLLFSLHTFPVDYILCTLASVIVYFVAKAVFPDREYEIPGDEEPKAAPKQETTGNPEIDALIQTRDRALSEMRRLNDNIPDEKISRQIDHLEEVTKKIIDQVVAQPKKLNQIRRFMDYYLPTTLKILNAYDRMGAAGVSGENIDATKDKVEGMMDTICKAFDKQLDALFGEEALDISTDITVMENLLAREGLSGMTMDSGDNSGAKNDNGIHLEL
jgi:hypothetical protein